MTPKVLVVDDDESVAITLAGILGSAGYRPEIANSADEAFRMLDDGQFDAAVVDLRLGEDSGLSVMQQLRWASPRTVFLVLTGYGSLETAVEALRLGASDYLFKPCDIGELKAALARGLERRVAEEAEIARFCDEFISAAAHELKTPVTSLRTHAQSLVRQYLKNGQLDPDRVVWAMRTIEQQSAKLSRLISQLLDVSRLETGRFVLQRERADLVALLTEVVALVQASYTGREIAVRGPDRLDATVDPARIEQVFANLLDNAVKHSPAGGTVEVDLDGPANETARISFRDHGIGVDPEDVPRVFERFSSLALSPAREHNLNGLGLGLYISREIVELHGGQITVEHPPDGGVRFIVILPTE